MDQWDLGLTAIDIMVILIKIITIIITSIIIITIIFIIIITSINIIVIIVMDFCIDLGGLTLIPKTQTNIT